jgi:hypothetical protein
MGITWPTSWAACDEDMRSGSAGVVQALVRLEIASLAEQIPA